MSGRQWGVGALVLGLWVGALAQPGEPVVGLGDYAHVSGGVGDESLERLDALQMGFNLKLTFALTAGDYLSGTAVEIAEAGGKVVVNAQSEGPFMLVRLPPGRYVVSATQGGVRKSQKLTVGARGNQTVHFRWASEG